MGYYYSFGGTGEPLIDDVLEQVRSAGKCYHHTDGWNEPMEWADGKSCVDLIEEAAQKSADEVKKLRDERDEWRRKYTELAAKVAAHG